MTFREKSAWVGLLVTLVVYGPYFASIFSRISPRDGVWSPGLGDLLGTFVGAVFLQLLLTVVFHGVLMLHGRRERPDERDRAIEAKSVQVAHGVLVTGCAMAGFGALALGVAASTLEVSAFQALVLLSQVLLFFLVAGETAQYLTRVIAYRRGA